MSYTQLKQLSILIATILIFSGCGELSDSNSTATGPLSSGTDINGKALDMEETNGSEESMVDGENKKKVDWKKLAKEFNVRRIVVVKASRFGSEETKKIEIEPDPDDPDKFTAKVVDEETTGTGTITAGDDGVEIDIKLSEEENIKLKGTDEENDGVIEGEISGQIEKALIMISVAGSGTVEITVDGTSYTANSGLIDSISW